MDRLWSSAGGPLPFGVEAILLTLVCVGLLVIVHYLTVYIEVKPE